MMKSSEKRGQHLEDSDHENGVEHHHTDNDDGNQKINEAWDIRVRHLDDIHRV